MSLFTDALAAGLATLRGVAGDTVAYRRGASSVQVTAVAARTRYTVTDENGTTITMEGRDYLVPVDELAQLALDDQLPQPQPGDLIDERYEAMPLSGEACFAYSDPARTQYRIHTKLVA